MNYYECVDTKRFGANEDSVWAIVKAKNELRAKRIFLTGTDARETFHSNFETYSETYKDWCITKIEDSVATRLDNLTKSFKEGVLNYHSKNLQAVFRDLGWGDENASRCDCCSLYDLGNYEGTYVEDEKGIICPDCANSEGS